MEDQLHRRAGVWRALHPAASRWRAAALLLLPRLQLRAMLLPLSQQPLQQPLLAESEKSSSSPEKHRPAVW
jgi:hypothetical protein